MKTLAVTALFALAINSSASALGSMGGRSGWSTLSAERPHQLPRKSAPLSAQHRKLVERTSLAFARDFCDTSRCGTGASLFRSTSTSFTARGRRYAVQRVACIVSSCLRDDSWLARSGAAKSTRSIWTTMPDERS